MCFDTPKRNKKMAKGAEKGAKELMGKDNPITRLRKKIERIKKCGIGWIVTALLLLVIGGVLLGFFIGKISTEEWTRYLAFVGIGFVVLGGIILIIGIIILVAFCVVMKRQSDKLSGKPKKSFVGHKTKYPAGLYPKQPDFDEYMGKSKQGEPGKPPSHLPPIEDKKNKGHKKDKKSKKKSKKGEDENGFTVNSDTEEMIKPDRDSGVHAGRSDFLDDEEIQAEHSHGVQSYVGDHIYDDPEEVVTHTIRGDVHAVPVDEVAAEAFEDAQSKGFPQPQPMASQHSRKSGPQQGFQRRESFEGSMGQEAQWATEQRRMSDSQQPVGPMSMPEPQHPHSQKSRTVIPPMRSTGPVLPNQSYNQAAHMNGDVVYAEVDHGLRSEPKQPPSYHERGRHPRVHPADNVPTAIYATPNKPTRKDTNIVHGADIMMQPIIQHKQQQQQFAPFGIQQPLMTQPEMPYRIFMVAPAGDGTMAAQPMILQPAMQHMYAMPQHVQFSNTQFPQPQTTIGVSPNASMQRSSLGTLEHDDIVPTSQEAVHSAPTMHYVNSGPDHTRQNTDTLAPDAMKALEEFQRIRDNVPPRTEPAWGESQNKLQTIEEEALQQTKEVHVEHALDIDAMLEQLDAMDSGKRGEINSGSKPSVTLNIEDLEDDLVVEAIEKVSVKQVESAPVLSDSSDVEEKVQMEFKVHEESALDMDAMLSALDKMQQPKSAPVQSDSSDVEEKVQMEFKVHEESALDMDSMLASLDKMEGDTQGRGRVTQGGDPRYSHHSVVVDGLDREEFVHVTRQETVEHALRFEEEIEPGRKDRKKMKKKEVKVKEKKKTKGKNAQKDLQIPQPRSGHVTPRAKTKTTSKSKMQLQLKGEPDDTESALIAKIQSLEKRVHFVEESVSFDKTDQEETFERSESVSVQHGAPSFGTLLQEEAAASSNDDMVVSDVKRQKRDVRPVPQRRQIRGVETNKKVTVVSEVEPAVVRFEYSDVDDDDIIVPTQKSAVFSTPDTGIQMPVATDIQTPVTTGNQEPVTESEAIAVLEKFEDLDDEDQILPSHKTAVFAAPEFGIPEPEIGSLPKDDVEETEIVGEMSYAIEASPHGFEEDVVGINTTEAVGNGEELIVVEESNVVEASPFVDGEQPILGEISTTTEASPIVIGEQQVIGEMTSTTEASPIVIGEQQIVGEMTSTTEASPIVIGEEQIVGEMTSTTEASPIVIGEQDIVGEMTSTTEASPIVIGEEQIVGEMTSTTEASPIVIGEQHIVGEMTSNTEASPIVIGEQQIVGETTSTTEASPIVIREQHIVGEMSSTTEASPIAIGEQQIVDEISTIEPYPAVNGDEAKFAQVGFVAPRSGGLLEPIMDEIEVKSKKKGKSAKQKKEKKVKEKKPKAQAKDKKKKGGKSETGEVEVNSSSMGLLDDIVVPMRSEAVESSPFVLETEFEKVGEETQVEVAGRQIEESITTSEGSKVEAGTVLELEAGPVDIEEGITLTEVSRVESGMVLDFAASPRDIDEGVTVSEASKVESGTILEIEASPEESKGSKIVSETILEVEASPTEIEDIFTLEEVSKVETSPTVIEESVTVSESSKVEAAPVLEVDAGLAEIEEGITVSEASKVEAAPVSEVDTGLTEIEEAVTMSEVSKVEAGPVLEVDAGPSEIEEGITVSEASKVEAAPVLEVDASLAEIEGGITVSEASKVEAGPVLVEALGIEDGATATGTSKAEAGVVLDLEPKPIAKVSESDSVSEDKRNSVFDTFDIDFEPMGRKGRDEIDLSRDVVELSVKPGSTVEGETNVDKYLEANKPPADWTFDDSDFELPDFSDSQPKPNSDTDTPVVGFLGERKLPRRRIEIEPKNTDASISGDLDYEWPAVPEVTKPKLYQGESKPRPVVVKPRPLKVADDAEEKKFDILIIGDNPRRDVILADVTDVPETRKVEVESDLVPVVQKDVESGNDIVLPSLVQGKKDEGSAGPEITLPSASLAQSSGDGLEKLAQESPFGSVDTFIIYDDDDIITQIVAPKAESAPLDLVPTTEIPNDSVKGVELEIEDDLIPIESNMAETAPDVDSAHGSMQSFIIHDDDDDDFIVPGVAKAVESAPPMPFGKEEVVLLKDQGTGDKAEDKTGSLEDFFAQSDVTQLLPSETQAVEAKPIVDPDVTNNNKESENLVNFFQESDVTQLLPPENKVDTMVDSGNKSYGEKTKLASESDSLQNFYEASDATLFLRAEKAEGKTFESDAKTPGASGAVGNQGVEEGDFGGAPNGTLGIMKGEDKSDIPDNVQKDLKTAKVKAVGDANGSDEELEPLAVPSGDEANDSQNGDLFGDDDVTELLDTMKFGDTGKPSVIPENSDKTEDGVTMVTPISPGDITDDDDDIMF